jgi:hypothetical protein
MTAIVTFVTVAIVGIVIIVGVLGGVSFTTSFGHADVDRIKRLNDADIDWIKRRGLSSDPPERS